MFIAFKKTVLLITRILSTGRSRQLTFAVLGIALIIAASAVGQSPEYIVGPGDTLYVSVWGMEALSGTIVVGPDGTIALPPPVGSVYVDQMTLEEITAALTKKLEEFVKNPLISVSISSFHEFLVHILGQVQSPSFYQIPDGTSIQELVTKAGGLTELADTSSVILIRQLEDEIEQQTIDFSRFLKQNDLESNPVLMNNDVVIFPRMDLDKKMEQTIVVLGRVREPGSYELEISLPLLDVIVMAGGFLDDSDLQNISVLRRSGEDGDLYRQVDLDNVLYGKSNLYSQEYKIYPGDIIFVASNIPLIGNRFYVNVVGQVAKPGAYEIAEGVRVIDAIFAAGGPAEDASIDNIALISSGQDSKQGISAISLISLKDFLLNGNLEANPVLHEGDTVVVPINESAKLVPPVQTAYSPSISVNVIGEVKNPGGYQISADSTLLDIVVLAGGPTSDANLKKTLVIRNIKSEGKEQFEVDLEEVMTEGRLSLLPAIFPGDTVFLPKAKEETKWWRSSISLARDVSTLIVLYLYLQRL